MIAMTTLDELTFNAAVERLWREHAWGEAERVVVNVDTAVRELRGTRAERDPVALMAQMGRLARRLA